MLKHRSRNKKGQTSLEYLLIIAVIAVAVSVFGKGFSHAVGKMYFPMPTFTEDK